MFATECEEVCLKVMNGCLDQLKFPSVWKTGRLGMIGKEAKADGAKMKYRSLCLLSVIDKLLDRMIGKRIMEEVESRGGLSREQYSFRRGKSTTDAVMRVKELALGANQETWGTRSYCVLVSLDVKNAFNSVPWQGAVRKLVRRRVSPYLVRMTGSYLNGRSVVLEDGSMMEMSAGVPQGSVLGPILWNIYYDRVLRLRMPGGVTLIRYADDLAIVAVEREE